MHKKSHIFLGYAISAILFLTAIPAVSSQDSTTLADQHFKKAVDLLKQIQYQDAIAEYEKVISLIPDSDIARDARYWIGQSYFQMGKHDEALSVFESLIQKYPESAIAPVTHLMVTRVLKDKENKKLAAKSNTSKDEKTIIDSQAGLKYTKTVALTGKNAVDRMGGFNISSNGKFLLNENLVIPLNDGESFELLERDAWRGSWSPDGTKVAFYSDDAVWIVPVSPKTGRTTGSPKKLIDITFTFQEPVSWSPDSEKIAFASRFEDNQGDIWTLSVKDGLRTQLTEDPIIETRPIWSPDGKTIAFSKGAALWTVSSEGGELQKIVNRGRPTTWSPDGNWIVYSTQGVKHHLLRLSDKFTIDIEPPHGVGNFLSWSSDGKKMLFFRSSYDYSCLLKVVSTAGGPSFELGRELKLWPYVHFWTPDSKKIITTGGYPIQIEFRDDLDFWINPLLGDEAKMLELRVAEVNKPQPRILSQDSKKLLFFEDLGDGKENLYVMPVSLEDAQPTGPAVMVFKGRDSKPVGFGRRDEWSWSPDGKKLALVHGGDIWITSTENGEPVRITEKPETETWPVWSPDGKKIAYIEKIISNKAKERKQVLCVISAKGGEAKQIVDVSDKEDFDWSPDGKELAIISDGKILVYPISGGKTREVIDFEKFSIGDGFNLSWLPDGKHFAIFGMKDKRDSSNRIYLISETGDELIELAADDTGWKDWLYPSPDGKWISYDSEGSIKVRSESTIWEVDFEEFISQKKKR